MSFDETSMGSGVSFSDPEVQERHSVCRPVPTWPGEKRMRLSLPSQGRVPYALRFSVTGHMLPHW